MTSFEKDYHNGAMYKKLGKNGNSNTVIIPAMWLHILGVNPHCGDELMLVLDQNARCIRIYPAPHNAQKHANALGPVTVNKKTGRVDAAQQAAAQQAAAPTIDVNSVAYKSNNYKFDKPTNDISFVNARAYQGLKKMLKRLNMKDIPEIFDPICVKLHNEILNYNGDPEYLFVLHGREYAIAYKKYMKDREKEEDEFFL